MSQNGLRAVQFTPPGSGCSVHFGTSQGAIRNDGFASSAAPGSAKSYLIVSDIVAARNALDARGIEVSEFFHVGESGYRPVWTQSFAQVSGRCGKRSSKGDAR